jgi:hypothetical protein
MSRSPSRSRRAAALVVSAVACLAVALAGAPLLGAGEDPPGEARVAGDAKVRHSGPSRSAPLPAPRLANPSATGRALAARYFRLLQAGDTAGLRVFLSSAFQIQRADGSAWNKGSYLRSGLPEITSFALNRAVGTQAGPALVVRYFARVRGVTNGRPYANAPAPRLSTFAWNGYAWRLTSHANFEPLPTR